MTIPEPTAEDMAVDLRRALEVLDVAVKEKWTVGCSFEEARSYARRAAHAEEKVRKYENPTVSAEIYQLWALLEKHKDKVALLAEEGGTHAQRIRFAQWCVKEDAILIYGQSCK